MQTTKQVFDEIMESDIFRLNGKAIDLPAAIIRLCDAIKAEDETDWSLGEFGECDLGSFIVGAFWAFTVWHGGQSSDTYAALCALGGIFSPGMTSGPEPDSSEQAAYELINEYFKGKQ